MLRIVGECLGALGIDGMIRFYLSWLCTLWITAAAEQVLKPPIEVDVVIVGAGQAGMAAAHRLMSLGHSVHVVEATDHVGGRTRNFDVGKNKFDTNSDDIFEVGGTWLSPQHTHALQQCKSLGIEVFNASFVDAYSPPPSKHVGEYPWWYWGLDYPEDQMKRINHTVFHSTSSKFRFSSPQELMSHLGKATTTALERAGDIIRNKQSAIGEKCWNASTCGPHWRESDTDSTAGMLGKYLTTPDAQQILRNTIHDHNAQEPEEVGFLYNLFSWNGCNSDGPDNKYRVRGGMQAVPIAMAARLGKNISLEAAVEVINASSQNIQIHTRNGLQLSSAAVVVTGPPSTFLGIDFSPPLTGVHAQLMQRMPMGTSMKFAAVYKQGPWWRQLGLDGSILATALPKNLSLPGTSIPIFTQCVDNSPFSGKFGVIACFVEGRQNLYFTALSAEKQEALMHSFLQLTFGDAVGQLPKPSHFVAHNWADEPFARGAYTSYFPPGVLSVPEYWAAYRAMEKLPGVFLAGADYHTGFGNGYIEGAIRSGQRAADLARARLQSRQSSSLLV